MCLELNDICHTFNIQHNMIFPFNTPTNYYVIHQSINIWF